MSLALATHAIDRYYTLKQAAEKLAFPSAHALRMYIKRREHLLALLRCRRVGRSTLLLVPEAVVAAIEAETVSSAISPSH